MEIFVTGASGFVGGAATQRLVADGHRVRAMARSDAAEAAVRALGAEPVRCDLDNVRAEHLAGAEAVLHSAAFVEGWGPPDAWYRGNVLGTRAMLEAARSAGVARFIHIGTEAAIVHGQHLDGVDEDYPLAPDSPYPYCATKAHAEMLVRGANSARFTTLVLRPRFIWGPGDKTLLPAIVGMARAGKWAWIDGGRARTSTVHIANLVHAIVLALTAGRGGEAYFILDDGARTLREVITGMAASAGLTLPERNIPAWLADTVGWVCENTWRWFGLGGQPPLTRHATMVMSRTCVLNGDKARRELGYTPVVGYDEGMRALRAGTG